MVAQTVGAHTYWYNGFAPFLFYPNFFFVLAGGVYYALSKALPLLFVGESVVDNFLIHILRSRSFAFVGLFVALFAGGAGDAIRRFVAGHGKVVATWLTTAALCGLLLVDASTRVANLQYWVQVDAHHNTSEKLMYLDAYQWLREHAPQPAVIGFDDRFKEFGNPGYNQMASRIVLETERFSLPGNQIEATRAHNAEVLSHLHDWDPARIHPALVRYNVSFLLTWVVDIEANLQRSSEVALVYRNAKVQVWEVRGHDFRFASGHAIRVGALDFSAERIAWTITCDAAECPVTLAIAYHPNWRAQIDGATISVRETEDHLMQVHMPRGTSALTFTFQRAWWESLAIGISAMFFGLSVVLWAMGQRRSQHRRPLGLFPESLYRHG